MTCTIIPLYKLFVCNFLIIYCSLHCTSGFLSAVAHPPPPIFPNIPILHLHLQCQRETFASFKDLKKEVSLYAVCTFFLEKKESKMEGQCWSSQLSLEELLYIKNDSFILNMYFNMLSKTNS